LPGLPYQDWLVQQEHATVQHALAQAAAPGSLPVYMLTVNVLRLLPVLAGFGLLYYWIGGRQTESTRKLRELLIIPSSDSSDTQQGFERMMPWGPFRLER
jgi:uncharacterized membrane protein